jgi:hypothetical protein
MAGICAGIFIKKGAKAVAWFLGGIFVLLQVCCFVVAETLLILKETTPFSILAQFPSFV